MLRVVVCACIAGLFALQPPAFAGDGDVFFSGIDVFDGKAKQTGVNVLVIGGVVQGVGADVKNPGEIAEVDGAGKTLLPGFIDAHTHAFFPRQLEQALAFGVTTELDMLCEVATARELREGRDDPTHDAQRADYYSAGAAVTVAGGHGTQFGFPTPTLGQTDNVASYVRDRVREGSDYIKLIYEDGSAYGTTMSTLNERQISEAADAATLLGKLAVAHVSTSDGANLAIRGGVDGLVHLFVDSPLTPEMVTKIKQQGVFVIPTAAVISNLYGENTTSQIFNHATIRGMLNNVDRNNLANKFPVAKANPESIKNLKHNILMLHKAGVPILAGTDSPNPGTVHGASLHHELQWLVSAGLSPSDVLASATSLPAKHFKLADRGRIAEGMRGDFVLVNGDPTTDIRATMNLVGVWKNGRPADLEAMVQKTASADKATKPNLGNGDLEISDFDDGTVTTAFGAGWVASTDKMMGGSSTASMKVVKSGADKSSHSLEVSGQCQAKQPRFAGVMFSPADIPMQPKNIGNDLTLSFWSKGDGTDQSVMLFFAKRGFQPSTKTFKATSTWTKHTFPIKDFNGCDGTDVLGIWFGNEPAGPFKFQIDEVRFTKMEPADREAEVEK